MRSASEMSCACISPIEPLLSHPGPNVPGPERPWPHLAASHARVAVIELLFDATLDRQRCRALVETWGQPGDEPARGPTRAAGRARVRGGPARGPYRTRAAPASFRPAPEL